MKSALFSGPDNSSCSYLSSLYLFSFMLLSPLPIASSWMIPVNIDLGALLQGRLVRDCWFWSGNSRCPAMVMVVMTESFYTPCPVGLSAPACARGWGLEYGGHVKQTCWVGFSGRHSWFFAFKVSFCSGSIKISKPLFFIIITKTGGKLAWTAITLCAWTDL